MTATWTTLFDGELEGRKVSVKKSNDATYKVETLQTVHDEGIAYQDGKNFVHVSPSSVGESVESEVTSVAALREALKELHFSPESVKAIEAKIS